MSTFSSSVIVVGAGPAGASLAYLLASHGLRVTLLERQRDFSQEFRGEILLPSGFEALEQMGLNRVLERVPQFAPSGVEVYSDRRPVFRLAMDAQFLGPHPPTALSQPAFLEAIIDAAAQSIDKGRTRELVAIQRIQAAPSKILMGHAWWGATLRFVLPRLLRFRIARKRAAPIVRRLLHGVEPVRLEVGAPPAPSDQAVQMGGVR